MPTRDASFSRNQRISALYLPISPRRDDQGRLALTSQSAEHDHILELGMVLELPRPIPSRAYHLGLPRLHAGLPSQAPLGSNRAAQALKAPSTSKQRRIKLQVGKLSYSRLPDDWSTATASGAEAMIVQYLCHKAERQKQSTAKPFLN